MQMLKRPFILAFFLFGSFLLASANQTGTPETPTTSLLWKISGKGLSSPSYIFGTFHIMCKDDFSITPQMEQALAASKQFYGELDMDDPNMQMQLLSGMRLPNKTLSQLMGTEAFTKASANFQQLTGMPLNLFDQFSPFMPISMLAIKGIDCADNVQPESVLVEKAQQLKLSINGLETVKDQIDAVNGEPLDSQIVSLQKTLNNFDSVKVVMQKMLGEYKKRDANAVYQFIQQNSEGNSDFESRMLVKRNKNWIPVITKAINQQPCFFAVGAGHLGGPQGVLALLKAEGYDVTPVAY